jgi:protein-disulfide isomerase
MALKRNPAIFKTLLIQQPQAPPIFADFHPIVFGNPDAEYKITIVTDPYCSSCSKIHKDLEQLVLQNQCVNAKVIFFTGNNSSPSAKVVTHILALAKEGNLAIEALADWYNQNNKDYDTWAKHYPVETHLSDLIGICQGHRKWCRDAGIMVTPTIYINGYKMPETYKLENLPWVLKRIEFEKVFESNV